MAFSREELLFVRESLLRGIRTDLRNPRESRRVEFQALDIPQADGSLRVTRGHTKLKVSLQFKEAEEEKFPHREIEEWLKEFKVGIRVDLEVENDDGNILGTFISGLRELLKEVEVPDILDLSRTIRSGVNLPEMRVVCLVGGVVVEDPLRVEEACCDASLVFVGEKGRYRKIWSKKCGEMDLKEISEMF